MRSRARQKIRRLPMEAMASFRVYGINVCSVNVNSEMQKLICFLQKRTPEKTTEDLELIAALSSFCVKG